MNEYGGAAQGVNGGLFSWSVGRGVGSGLGWLSKQLTTRQSSSFAPGKLEPHYNKHVIEGQEWGSQIMTISQYEKRASDLINSKPSDFLLSHKSASGHIFRYNRSTNEFATAKPNGTIETLFKPANGLKYWNEQLRRYP